MAAPQRRPRASIRTRPVAPRVQGLEGRDFGPARRKVEGRRRRFAVVVVIPVLLMLGSVYLHTIAAGLSAKATTLEERLARVRAEGERLEVRVAELSGADRIRPLAAEKLGMKVPGGKDLEVYGVDREDGTRHGGEKEGGKPR